MPGFGLGFRVFRVVQGFLYRFLEDLPLRALEGFLGLKIYVDVARLTPQSDHEK